MGGAPVVPADDRRHPPGDDRRWQESWELDLVTADGGLGATFRLTLHPHDGVSWVWCSVVGEGRRLVTVVELEAPLPRAGSLDLRCEGLWIDLVCEAPLEHWSVGLEAFGVALDDPIDALRGLRGDRVGVGLDVGWERAGEPWVAPGGCYVVPATVAGEVLVGDEVLLVDGWGTWIHRWGVVPRRSPSTRAVAGRLDDGTTFLAAAGAGVVIGPDGVGHEGAALLDDDGLSASDGLPSTASVSLGALDLALAVEHLAPVPLPARGASALVRALCSVRATDGRAGTAWWTTTG